MYKSSELSNVVHEVLVTSDNVQVDKADKNVPNAQIKSYTTGC